jgi:acetyl-CoA C-acetyltransferase
MARSEIVVVGAARTAIGTYGGSLKDVPMTRLGAIAVRAALERSGAQPAQVGHVVMGNVIPTDPTDAYIGRVSAIDAGIPKEVPSFHLNRQCGSGLQAIISAAQSIMLGDADVAIGGGVESMSRAVYIVPAARWGARMGDTPLVDYMTGALQDPWQRIHMGVTAENVAERYGITREMQDALALESQRRAARAIAEGRFTSQITPVEIKSKKGPIQFEVDEHVRPNVTPEQLARMEPVFKKGGVVTVGNASGLNDGAAAVALAEAGVARKLGLKPLARLVGYAFAGVDPAYMGIGPVPATRNVLERTGLQVKDLDVIESNEAFAAQACAVTRELGLDPEKVNPNGSGISLGHPVGATGAVITIKAIYELHRIGGRYALVTMCIGGGQGIAAIFERV